MVWARWYAKVLIDLVGVLYWIYVPRKSHDCDRNIQNSNIGGCAIHVIKNEWCEQDGTQKYLLTWWACYIEYMVRDAPFLACKQRTLQQDSPFLACKQRALQQASPFLACKQVASSSARLSFSCFPAASSSSRRSFSCLTTASTSSFKKVALGRVFFGSSLF